MKTLTIALTAVLAMAGSALAGTADTIKVHFANPVMVGEKVMPAGDAVMNVLRSSSDYLILTVRTADGEAAAVVVKRVTNGDERDATSVVLGRYGNQLRLERVLLDDGTGFAISQ